ncbi:lung adenoma susceptibility protein 2 isoform X1 [Apus apus]|uniref:lung adenoma susceptibility protein 2 isoform X1 n=1 Tax=Apus apus TaxID=8895 RepID=UPI0021F8D562|nr:lung adenoma susceptibility protein 2 isoform X1 [Apus apus]XP_051498470.1 lung adenoma susceptibility protein 2 isoform X1 [Apus apus]XP_051498471.1 lung adenoma susceptibility protein 2 isoform X1 [Apus apus]XP_051498472.1 lung adenoma susceptibility protein 2 isoform X1 [Apus apus]XP_051498473.1 lung adenoma susceptibility protein 2 isoform X1 [Apus apus]XP_051498474.1 lung adenoma susceptibility protein 2 isoform X1 [Apus apus]
MASSVKGSSGCSPDSTVSSLLRSCGIDSSHPGSSSWIHYKGKLYSSASEALEAYIEDYNLSLTSPGVSTGKICLCQSTPKQVKFSKHHAKEKHALGDFNQQRGLGLLASPCGGQAECDPDLVSLTTDDLLGFPEDGSLPLVQSPSQPKHPSSGWNRWSSGTLQPSFCPHQTSSLNPESPSSPQKNGKAAAHQDPHRDLKKWNLSTPDGYDPVSRGSPRALSLEENSNTVHLKNYPGWLSSHKSDFSVSGMSSIPKMHFPVWLQKEGPSVDKDNVDFLDPSAFLDLRGDNQVEESGNYASPDACCPFDTSFLRGTKKPFREGQLGLLPLKADMGLESSAEELAKNLEPDGSSSTTETLETERSWEKAPAAVKPPVPGCCEDMENALSFPKAEIIHQFLEDCLRDKNKEQTFCGDHHDRPLEALKFMLFKLQAIQGSLSQNETAEPKEEFEKINGLIIATHKWTLK